MALEAEQVAEDEETDHEPQGEETKLEWFLRPPSSPLPFERKDVGFSLCHLNSSRASKDTP